MRYNNKNGNKTEVDMEIVGKRDFFEVKHGNAVILRFLGYDAPEFNCENFENPYDFCDACSYYFGDAQDLTLPEDVDEELTERRGAFLAEVTEFAEGISVDLAKEMFECIAKRFGGKDAVYVEFEDSPALARGAVKAGFDYFATVAGDGDCDCCVGDAVGQLHVIFKKEGETPLDKVFDSFE